MVNRIRFPYATIMVSALCVVVFLTGQRFSPWLYFDSRVVAHGEWWRLVTGHLVHGDSAHLFWDLLGLVILGAIVETQSRLLFVKSLLVGVIAVDLLLLSPFAEVDIYCGMSGVLNTLLITAIYLQWRSTRSRLVILTALACAGKIATELWFERTLLTQISWPPYPPAHLAGFLGGLLLIAWMAAARLSVETASSTRSVARRNTELDAAIATVTSDDSMKKFSTAASR